MNITITHIDTACISLDINGYRILTDPTLDKAGRVYYHGAGSFSRKTGDPAVDADHLLPVDLILLSHHQHKDNFDKQGRSFALKSPLILSTKKAQQAIPQIVGLSDWEQHVIDTPKVPGLRITAAPAQHHPWWLPEFFSGKVIGFLIEFDGQTNGAIYISGDTVYFKGIEEVAKRFTVDIGIFHLGSVEFRYLTGFGRYTMNGKDLSRAAKVIQPKIIIPVHYKGWSHFKENESKLRRIIAADELLQRRTLFLQPGKPVALR